MVYMGSKNRIAKDLLKIIEPYLCPTKNYYEPFVGGANFIDKIPKDKCKRIIGNDYNEYLIALLNHVKHNEIEYKFIEKKDWYDNYLHPFRKNGEIIIKEKKLEPWEIGYLGFTKTFSGVFMSSYCGNKEDDKTSPRNYQLQKHNNITNQAPKIKEIEFIHGCYTKMQIEDNSIVYVDGPYKDTAKYKDDIDHDELYDWIRDLVNNKNCIVFVSEYQMPPDFTCVWEKELKAGMGSKKQTEKLFMLKNHNMITKKDNYG